ncbi:MAG: endolytic transglycosylase MltG [Actinobacteria bacterium]|nr:endolytic transglycosylase MltG [Actinomycetota bacterium]
MKILNNHSIRVVLAFLFVAILSLSIHTVRSDISSAPDFPTANIDANSPVVVVEIPAGASGSAVGQILYESKVTKSALAYFRAAVADPRSAQVAPGAHELNLGISARQALAQLLDPARIPNLIKVFEGAWKSEVIDSLLRYGFTKKEIDTAFKKVVLPAGFSNAEGLLFPAQYSFPAGTSALEVVQAMVDRFSDEAIGQELLAAKGKYSPAQLLTIASLIQAEGGAGDFYKVSRVIRNRLAISMPLQLDATVHYVKKLRGEIFLSTNSTLIKSPYNTYRNYGLPPTPIGNPGSEAIAAALKPAAGDWLYFITVAPGDTRFTRSHDEFLTWKALFVKNRKAGAFK